MVPRAGLEPARSCLRGILNPLCLPIPPPGLGYIINYKSHLSNLPSSLIFFLIFVADIEVMSLLKLSSSNT